MSNIRAGTISGVNGTDPITLTKQSAAKAWVLYDQSSGTATISNSFGLSSLTDGSTGRATINYTNAFSSIEYSPTGSCGPIVGISNSVGLSLSPNLADFTASATVVNTRRRDTNADSDVPQITLHALGDLA